MIDPTLVAFAYCNKIILSAAINFLYIYIYISSKIFLVCINSTKFSLGYSLLIKLGPVGDWGRLPTYHSGLILTTVRYKQPSLLTFRKSILSNHYFTEKKTLHKLQFHLSLQTISTCLLPTLLNRLSATAGINLFGC